MTPQRESRPSVGAEAAEDRTGEWINPIVPPTSDSWHRRAYRAAVLRLDAGDLVALAVVVLWTPIGWWSA